MTTQAGGSTPPAPGAARARRPWRRYFAAIGLALLVAALLSAGRTAERAASRVSLRTAFERELGVRIETIGSISPALWPSPGVTARNVAFLSEGPMRRGGATSLSIHLDLFALVFGRIRASGVTVAQGEIEVDLALPAPANWRAAAAREARSLGRVRLIDTRLAIFNGPAPVRTILVKHGEAIWRDAGSPAALIGEGALEGDGRPLRATLFLQRPAELWNGRTSLVLGKLAGSGVEVEAQGEYAEGVGFRGRFLARTDDLGDLREKGWFDFPGPSRMKQAALRAELAWTHRGWAFTDAQLNLEDNLFEGSLNLRHDEGRPSLSGTLAAGELEATAWLEAAPRLIEPRSSPPRWREEPLDWSAEMRGDVDVRISAGRLRMGRLDVRDVAMAVLMKRGRLELTLSEASGYKGSARGRLSVTPSPAGLEVKGSARWDAIDLAALPPGVIDGSRLSGVFSGQANFDALGRSPKVLAGTLDGRATFSLTSGAIAGLDLEGALRRPNRGIPAFLPPGGARTPFDSLTATIRALRGSAQIEQAALNSPAVLAAGRGVIDLGALRASIRVEASQPPIAGQAPAQAMQFYLSGPVTTLAISRDGATPP